MRFWSVAPYTAIACAALGGAGAAFADAGQRVTGPHVHENLAIYFIHGASVDGPVPLTLTEAVAKGRVQVTETGQVNELKIENTGDEEVFIQAGDIVKGGRQDRVLMVSLLLPPRSGELPISSFCVEAGRWSGRAGEDATRFASAAEAMPSRRALLAMAAPPVAEPINGANPKAVMPEARQVAGTPSRQKQVWDSVARTQESLTASLGAHVNAPQS